MTLFQNRLLSVLAVVVVVLSPPAISHGRMLEPPSRMSAWRMGKPGLVNYNDHEQWCGIMGDDRKQGLIDNNGKCGVCGDRWDVLPRKYELPDGEFMQGVQLVNTPYVQGQTINITILVTQTHLGYMEFRLCNRDSLGGLEATPECLNQNLLALEGGSTRFYVEDKGFEHEYHLRAMLPADVTCSQCLLQWKYRAGNDWGCDNTCGCRTGCGIQEEFYACSDIVISARDGAASSTTTTATTTRTTPPPTTTTTTPPTTASTTPKTSPTTQKTTLTTTTTTTTPTPTTTTTTTTTTTAPNPTTTTTTTTPAPTTTTPPPTTTTTTPTTTTTTTPTTTTTTTTPTPTTTRTTTTTTTPKPTTTSTTTTTPPPPLTTTTTTTPTPTTTTTTTTKTTTAKPSSPTTAVDATTRSETDVLCRGTCYTFCKPNVPSLNVFCKGGCEKCLAYLKQFA